MPECGRFVMLPGNAAYSKPKRLKEFLKAMNGEIRVYFPAYAPGPNLAEAGGSRSEKQRGTPLREHGRNAKIHRSDAGGRRFRV